MSETVPEFVMAGEGLTVIRQYAGCERHVPMEPVMAYVTLPGVSSRSVRVWLIPVPAPGVKPVILPEVRLADQEKVVRGEDGVSPIEVEFPEQMVCDVGSTTKLGAGATGII